jgi:ribonuclease P/MRP protein subunit POP5
MKVILPTLKERNRYIVYQVNDNKKLTIDEIKKEMKRAMMQFLGEWEYAKANILILDDFKKNRGIIKVNNKYVDKVKVSLMLIKPFIIETRGVSGTLKKARSKFIGGN